MPTVFSSGTQSATITTEHSLLSTTVAGTFVFAVNTVNMAAGDLLELVVKTKVLSGDTIAVAHKMTFTNAQEEPVKVFVPVASDLGADFTLKQVAGTGRSYPWKVLVTDDLYHADINLTRDTANTQDEYTVTWFKDGVRLSSGITSPTVQVVKRADGTDLIAATAMTQVGSTGSYKYDATGAARIGTGEAVLVVAAATINSSARTFSRLVSRDS